MITWRGEEENRALTDELVTLAEEKLGVELPASYIKLLREHNGGYIMPLACATTEDNSWADGDHVQIDHFYGIVPEEGLLLTPYLLQEWDLPDGLVLFAGDGHHWFAFDYRKADCDPPITYIEPDSDVDFVLADSFEAFLAQLFAYEEES